MVASCRKRLAYATRRTGCLARAPDRRRLSWPLVPDAIEVRERNGKTYYVMTDVKAFQEGVGRLLAEVQRIKAEGDYDAARKLFETYGVHFDPKLRDQVVERVDRLKMPSYTGFVQPRLQPVNGTDGKTSDVRITYPMDLTAQMLEYSGRKALKH